MENRQEIVDLYNLVNNRLNTRKNPEKRQALIKLLEKHNDLFDTAYNAHNVTCHRCVRRVLSNFENLIKKWQTKEK